MIQKWNELYGYYRHKLPIALLQILFDKLGLDFSPFYWVQEGIFEDSRIDFGNKFCEYTCETIFVFSLSASRDLLSQWREYSEKRLSSMLEDDKICISAK